MSVDNQYQVNLTAMPSLISLYRKIFLQRKPGWDQQPLPNIHVTCPNISLDKQQVQKYADVCHYNFNGQHLPLTYLYILAFRLHATIFTHKGITFPLIGMIHLKNSITEYRKVLCSEQIDLECELTESRTTDAGLEFDLISRVHINGELVWQSLSTYLYRIESNSRRIRPPKAGSLTWSDPITWSLDEGLGRRYAKASGDYNLIHLHPLLSKRFGFERVLAHGMWSKARCIAEIAPLITQRPCTVDVAFKLPLFMPSEVTFASEQDDNEIKFELRDVRGKRPHISGKVSFN